MKKQTRRQSTPAFKAKVALEAIKGQYTLTELANKFEVNQVIISQWKAEFQANMAVVFKKEEGPSEPDVDTQELFAQIGQFRVENEFYKKVSRNLGGTL